VPLSTVGLLESAYLCITCLFIQLYSELKCLQLDWIYQRTAIRNTFSLKATNNRGFDHYGRR